MFVSFFYDCKKQSYLNCHKTDFMKYEVEKCVKNTILDCAFTPNSKDFAKPILVKYL